MKTKFIIVIASLVCVLTGCAKETVVSTIKEDLCRLELDVRMPESAITKASISYTSSVAYEDSVNKVQILVFSKSSGLLEKYKDAGKSLKGISMDLTKGTKELWAVVNGPDLSAVKTLNDLKNTTVNLGTDNGIQTSKGMIMTGSAEVTISAAGSSCAVTVSRMVSRIALVSIQNSLPEAYGNLQIVSATLTNVVVNQNISGTAKEMEWCNRYGRADEKPQVSSHFIDGATYKASCPDLTFKSLNLTLNNTKTHTPQTPYLFYTMPNSSTTAPSAFSTTFTAQRTVLVLKAIFSTQTYFYPVVLDKAVLERNKTYAIAVNITGPGSSDPNTPVEKGDCSVSITMADWVQGTDYNVTI